MIGKPTAGRLLVKKLPKKIEEAGFLLPDEKNNSFAIVEELGPPDPDLYTWWKILWFQLTGKHPSPIKVGMKILVPHMKGRLFMSEDGSEYFVFAEMDIDYYDKSK